MESTLNRKRLKLELSKGQRGMSRGTHFLMTNVENNVLKSTMSQPPSNGLACFTGTCLRITSHSVYPDKKFMLNLLLIIWVTAMPFSQLTRLETLLITDSSLPLTLTFKPPNLTRSFQGKGEAISKFKG